MTWNYRVMRHVQYPESEEPIVTYGVHEVYSRPRAGELDGPTISFEDMLEGKAPLGPDRDHAPEDDEVGDWTGPVVLDGFESVEDVRLNLQAMLWALDSPVLECDKSCIGQPM